MSDKVEKILIKVRQLRKAKGLTQGNMIATVDVETAAAYNRMEKNANISVKRLLQIAEALDVDIKVLFDVDDNISPILELNDERAEIGYATKEDVSELKLMLRGIKAEIATIKAELQKPNTAKGKKK